MNKFQTYVSINTCDYGSTGRIAKDLLINFKKRGYDTYFFVGYQKYNDIDNVVLMKGSKLYHNINKILSRFDGNDGFRNSFQTKKLIKFLETKQNVIVHIHNLHGNYINIEILLKYLSKRKDVKILYTLHDCWAFTGKCPYFDFAMCDKWKKICGKCCLKKQYPVSWVFDKTKHMFLKKKYLFSLVKNQIIFISPSMWLKNLAEKSFLSNFVIKHIPNGIFDDSIFKNEHQCGERVYFDNLPLSSFKDKKVIFSAAYPFSERKGLKYILESITNFKDNQNYVFIVAGISPDKYNYKNAFFLGKIFDKNKMNFLYSISDAFLNPTLEDNFPTVNLESLANGTPIITFNTGGSPECLENDCGIVVEKYDSKGLINAISSISKKTYEIEEKCICQSKKFTIRNMFYKYLKLVEN